MFFLEEFPPKNLMPKGPYSGSSAKFVEVFLNVAKKDSNAVAIDELIYWDTLEAPQRNLP